MTSKKSTKRALLVSALSLLMCVSMLVGSTFAWFTDEVTSGSNIIKSGKLEVALLDANGDSLEGEPLEFVDQTGKVLSNILWEPGCTYTLQPVYVKNIGTLALKYEIVISGIEGNAKLLEAIEWTINGAALKGSLEPNASTGALQITGHMKEEAGNEYQGLEMDGISITVYATQVNAESDSFGPDYDKNAPLLVWDGSVDTSWYDASEDTYELSSPAKLAGLATLVNGGNSFAGKSIKLAADMDLNNLTWTAIGTGTANFNGKFYGNGFTIYNLKVSGTKGVGLIGFAGNAAHIEGVHIVGANVNGVNSVGAVLGYGYLAADCLKNCVVEDAIVYAAAGDSKEDGDKVGAVAGWTSNGNIIGNKAIDCKIYGCRDIGGIVGYVNGENRAVEVSGNTVENVTISVIDTDYSEPEKMGTNINDTVGRTGSRVTVKSNSGKITKEENVTVASTTDELKAAAASGGEVVVVAGSYTFPGSAIKEGTTLVCSPATIFNGNSGLNIDGATVVGATFSNASGNAVGGTINGIFKGCDFTGSNALRYCYAGETVVFEDCTFSGDVYGVHFDGGANEVIFRNCVFSGFNATAAAIEKITFDGCTFVGNGKSAYNGINLWGNGDFTDCTFVFDGSSTYEWIELCSANKTATFTDCVVTDGTTEKGVETVVSKRDASSKIIVDGVQMITSGADVSNALASTGSATLNSDVTYSSNFTKDSAIELNGNDFEATDTLTLTNNADLSMKNGSYTVNGTYGHVDVRPTEGSTLVFEGVDFSYNKKNNTYGPSTDRLGTVVEVCAIAADAKTVILFKDCTFDNAQVLFEGLSGTIGEFDATFDGCTFNALTSSAPIYVQNYVKGTLTVKNCTFNLTCTSSSASAISVSSSNSTSVKVITENNTINAVAATPYTYDESKGETSVDNIKVNGTPANIKFISIGGTTSTATETNTTKTGIAK